MLVPRDVLMRSLIFDVDLVDVSGNAPSSLHVSVLSGLSIIHQMAVEYFPVGGDSVVNFSICRKDFCDSGNWNDWEHPDQLDVSAGDVVPVNIVWDGSTVLTFHVGAEVGGLAIPAPSDQPITGLEFYFESAPGSPVKFQIDNLYVTYHLEETT
jgi:hypothetical protein